MRALAWIVSCLAMFAVSLPANADNRVAASRAAPHVAAMTTPGVCQQGYAPGVYNSNRACIACDAGLAYYPNPSPAICAGCPAGYKYNSSVGACFP